MTSHSIVTIVPFYNRRHTILPTLAGVAAQTVRPDRLVAVDDGSTDGGAEVVRRWMERSGAGIDCRLIVQANGGASAARNRGLSVAGDCQYVAFLDSDDIWPRDFLERTARELATRGEAVAVTCDRRFVFADGKPSQWHDSSQIVNKPPLWIMEHGGDIASATLFRTQAVERRGGFNSELRSGEDSALFMPLSLDGPWLHAPGEPATYQRGLAATLGDERNLTVRFRDNHRIWARMYEDFFVRGGGETMLADPRCRRLLAQAWYLAGRELYGHDAHGEAAHCFFKSWAWNPSRTRYAAAVLRAWLTAPRRQLKPKRQTPPIAPHAESHAALAR